MEAFLEDFQHLKIELEEIMSATSNFDHNNVIGRGGFGRVYEGTISHAGRKSMVAFKRLDRRYGQGDPEFLKEILMLSRYVHVNLISLLGFCEENGEKILVYELASHGSLDRHLSSTTLTWMQRLKICLAAARGLSYLHDPKETQQRVIHRDIQSSNILLDQNWNAKVSDMGLSKIGPANQSHSFLATNVVGTCGYIDPMYFQTSILTKESDVYSFGVVLFEVLCGRLCYENNNGLILTLAQTWRKSYKQKRLDDIIFQNLKQHMDLSSLETFSDLAYRCLQKYREERPKMSEVVEKLEIALRFQESFEDVEPVMDYKEMCKSASPSQPCRSQDQLKMVLSNGILINNQKTWFSVNKNGDHCEMISAAGCLIPIDPLSTEYVFYGREKSRFAMGYYRKFKTDVRTQYLSPHITYTVNLVFQLQNTCKEFLGLNYILDGETRSSTLYIAYKRKDRWLRAELYQFTSERRDVNMEITFECRNQLAVGGIEFQPLERHQVLEDEEVDMQHISHSDIFWEQKLPTDYEDIIKWSKDSLQWTTKKDLYSVFHKGFPINNGEEWFSLAKNGKKCHMLSARMALQTEEWRWQCLSTSRFREVAIDPDSGFLINCILERMQLNFFTTYESYLVYKLQENHSIFEPPVEVSLTTSPNRSWYIYLLSPQTPIIKGSMYQDTRNLINNPKIKGLPQQRNDGWMEVQVWKFRTGGTIARISKDLQLKFYDNRQFKGLIVQGIEFKPI